MKEFQVIFDKNCILRLLPVLAILIFVEPSCKNQHTSIVIHPKFVFSELDTFVTSAGNTQINKSDYYLIKDFTKDKIKMKSDLDGFVNTHPEFKSPGFGNYIVSFYLEDGDLNESIIKQEKFEYRYKLFTFYKEKNYLVDYTFRDMKLSYINWSSEYYK
jgi:hypothetical protein